MKVGVLAIQGDFAEHEAMLLPLGVQCCQVRLPEHLEGLDALIMPGGESTTFGRLMDLYQLREPIIDMARRNVPIWGTCAGMIMMAQKLTEDRPVPLGLMNIHVQRNAFGRQVDSFETDLNVVPLGKDPFKAVFIRAPIIVQTGSAIEVLACLPDGRPVAVRQGRLLATSFHPELTSDSRLHSYFLDMSTVES